VRQGYTDSTPVIVFCSPRGKYKLVSVPCERRYCVGTISQKSDIMNVTGPVPVAISHQ